MQNRSMDLLKYRSLPELAAAVRAASPAAMGRWEAAVLEYLPAARGMAVHQIRNDLPKIIEMIAAAIEANEPHPVKVLMEESTTHGQSRFDSQFDLGQMMTEYCLLRRILTEEVTEQLGRPLELDELGAMHLGVDVAVRRSVVQYASEQRAELQAVVEAQTKYLSFLSHDLRGGLNGVLLMIEVLRRDLVKESKFAGSLEDLDMMRRSILETVGTMDRFLHAERFRKGKVLVKPGTVRLGRLVEEIVAQYTYQARDKGLQLRAEVGPIEVTSDRELLALILQNLVANAVKYSARGAVRVVSSHDCAEGRVCRLSVLDEGPGIAPEKLHQLFGAFQRGDTHGQPGTGLGLSIARQAADLLGAKIWAESKPGEGSVFHVELPKEPPRSAKPE